MHGNTETDYRYVPASCMHILLDDSINEAKPDNETSETVELEDIRNDIWQV